MTVTLLGVDHRSAPDAVRDALVLDGDQVEAGLLQLATLHPGTEALVLATCARTEVLLAGQDTTAAAATWHTFLAAAVPGAEPCLESVRRVLVGAAAVRHVLRVATGVDSPLIGDVDLLAQLRTARARAASAGTLGPRLGRLVDSAISTGRRARAQTSIAAGAPSVAAAVVAELGDVAPDARNVVVVGAGGVATAVVAALPTTTTVAVVNRTRGRAVDLVGTRPGSSAHSMDELHGVLRTADAVVLATGGGVVLTRELIAASGLVGRGVPVVDASAPSAVARVTGLVVRGLPELHQRRDATSARREAAIPQVEVLVDDAVAAWRAVEDRRHVEGAIASLFSSAPELIEQLQDTTDAREVERTVRRFLHDHVSTLRQVSEAG